MRKGNDFCSFIRNSHLWNSLSHFIYVDAKSHRSIWKALTIWFHPSGLICISDGRKKDVFSVCSFLLEKSQSSDILSKYIEFFGNVLKTVMTYDNQNFKKLVEQKIESSDLYYKLINLLNEENIDKIFLNNVAKVVYYSTTKSIVEAIVMGETGINIKHLVKKLHSKYMKYLSLTCHLLMKHWWVLRISNLIVKGVRIGWAWGLVPHHFLMVW